MDRFCSLYVSRLSCFLVCSLQPCGHLLGKDWPFGSLVCDIFLCFVIFPCGVLGADSSEPSMLPCEKSNEISYTGPNGYYGMKKQLAFIVS